MRSLFFLLTLLSSYLLGLPVSGQDAEPIRTWKDITGSFSIQATFQKMDGDFVVLQRTDEKELTLPLSKLSVVDQQYARQRHAVQQRYLSARRVTPSDNLAAIVASARNNSAIKLTAGTFHLRPQKPYDQGILVENKRGLIITGAGKDKTIIKLASSVDAGFLIGSKVADLRIENLHIEGTPPLQTNTAGIGSTSNCTDVQNVVLNNLRVDHVAIGIFLTTNTGVVEDVKITNNTVSHTVGTDAGWGYGIHTRRIGNVLIAHNFIEHATRHSIYVRESPPGSKLVVEDNFILNHDLHGKNPRWYCAALNCPKSRAVTRIANNYFMNSNAIGIALMLDKNATGIGDLALVNNQIIGEHYVGIWPTTGETHTALANSIVLHSKPAHPEWCHKTSSFDWANGKKTNSHLEAPNARWTDPDFTCQLAGSLFVMKNGTLDKITPYAWTFQTAPKQWTDVKGMCALKNARGQGAGRLYVITGNGFFEVNPATWETKQTAGDWSKAKFVAATADRVHILNAGRLHSVNLVSLEVTKGDKDWSAIRWMCAWHDHLYVFDGQAHHRINPATLESVLVSQEQPR